MNSAEIANPFPVAHSSFPTTHWSVVINAGTGSESQAHAALETLCRQYWYPLYAFTRRHGRAHHLQLNAAPMQEAERWLETYRTFWEGALDSLAAYLENPAAAKKKKTKP